MEKQEYESVIANMQHHIAKLNKRIEEQQHYINELMDTAKELVNHNLQLVQQLETYYDVRRRVRILKELHMRNLDLMRRADLRDDDELMAIIETRVEQDKLYENPDFGLKELAELVGSTQSRITELFRRLPLYKTLDDYLDYLRILGSIYYLTEKPSWSVAACAQQAGFKAIRSFNRKFQDAIGMSPHEYRLIADAYTKPAEKVELSHKLI